MDPVQIHLQYWARAGPVGYIHVLYIVISISIHTCFSFYDKSHIDVPLDIVFQCIILARHIHSHINTSLKFEPLSKINLDIYSFRFISSVVVQNFFVTK